MEQHDFEMVLSNYRDGIQKIIPAYLTGKMADQEASIDELALVLHSRDELEWAFAVSPPQWQKYGPEVDDLDRLLLAMKEALLTHFAAYVTFRRQFPRPRSHWWYYLDEIVSIPAESTLSSDKRGYWIAVVSSQKAAAVSH